MEFEVKDELDAVRRSVSSPERDGQPARAVALSRRYETTLEDLWDAVTDEKRIPRWFLPVSGDLRRGGRYQLEGNAGGAITACDHLAGFSLTWEFCQDVSWVDVCLLNEGPDGARLTLTHIARHSDHWEAYGPGALGVGWELGFLGLALHVRRPSEPKPDEAAFVASTCGKAFIDGSSCRWGQADISAGRDPGSARAAAERTCAFYTGEPPESDEVATESDSPQ